MSFFANLLGGTMQGIGAGMTSMAADDERLARERALIQERSQAALELQRERAADRLYQQQEMAALKAANGGGAGGGGKGINLAAMAMQAKTPEEQDQVIRLANTFGGQNSGRLLADQMFNRPEMVGVAPTAGDFARYDRAGQMEAAPPKGAMERAAYDRDQGTLGLQRLYTAFLDPGKLDDHAKGERQFGLNDFGTAVAGQTMQRGGSLPDASAAFQKYSSTVDDSEKNRLRGEAIAASRERTAVQADNSSANRTAQDARALDRQIAEAYKEMDKARPTQKADHKKRIEQLEARRDAMDGAALAPALTNYQPGAAVKAPSPTEVLPKPRSPAEAAKAYQYKPGSFTLR